jgi:chromosome segregation ATPase
VTTTDDTATSVEDVVRRFSDAESALREILANADRLSSASERLEEAQAAIVEAQSAGDKRLEEARAAVAEAELAGAKRLEEARAALRKSESSLAEASSAVYGLTVELKDIAGDLKDTAVAFRRLKPEELREDLAAIRHAQGRVLLVAILAVVSATAATIAALV